MSSFSAGRPWDDEIYLEAGAPAEQIARLERYTAWARTELERLRAAGEYPARQHVLQANIAAAHSLMVELLEGRRNGEPA